MKNITIIGGGANGISAFIELFIQLATARLLHEVRITIIEKDDKLGYGLAFGTPQPGHILNTQADLMGIYANEPTHFAHWLEKNKGRFDDEVKAAGDMESAYTTRKLYGHYISDQAKCYLGRAKEIGLEVNVVQGEAKDVVKEEATYQVIVAGHPPIHSDFVILALGTPKPNNFEGLLAYTEYLDFPWPASRIKEKIPSEAHVGVLGTSLSAIDCVMTLLDNAHRGKISLFSPDGLFPRVQPTENKAYERKYLTLSAIHRTKRKSLKNPQVKTLIRLFMKEVEHYEGHPVDWSKLLDRNGSASSLINWDITCAEEGGDALLNVADSLRYDASTIWSWMDTDQKVLFKKWVGTQWAINRHPMPLHNAYKLKRCFDTGQLEVNAMDSPEAVNHLNRAFEIKLSDKRTINTDFLINATGSSSALAQMDSELIDNLLQRELISSYEVGGAKINERTMQLIAPHAGANLYAVGHIANGMLMDVNAVWYNVRTIGVLVKDLILRINEAQE